jgi:23S rRNA pseudouridine2604 synthase
MDKVRLSKLMSEQGFCSRREADAWIEKGWVFVDGVQIKELGTKVDADARIEISEHARREQDRLITVILNKPVGVVSAQPEGNYRPAIELLEVQNYGGEGDPRVPNPRGLKNLAVAGRLDIDSQGLLIFTQDGRIAKHLIEKDSGIEKEYIVRVAGEKRPDQLRLLQDGVLEIEGQRLKKAGAEWINEDQLRITLTEGKKRQVRKMCEMVGLEVRGLKRTRIGKLRLGKLAEGQWRFLEDGEEF